MTHETKSRCRKSGALTLMRKLFKMTPSCFIVLARLLDLDKDDRGDFFICAKTIAVETGAGLDAVYDALIRLEAVGLIRRPQRSYKDSHGRYRPGKIKHTVFTRLFYQIIYWADEADCQSEDEFKRLALEIKNSNLLDLAIEAQAEQDPDRREIPNFQDALLPDYRENSDQHTRNPRSGSRKIPNRILRNSPTEKSKENSLEAKKREGESLSWGSPEEHVIHSNGSDRNHAPPQRNPEKVWAKTLQDLYFSLPEITFETWVRDTNAKEIDPDTNELIVEAPHSYACHWLQDRLADKISRFLPDGLKPRFIVRGAQRQPPARDQQPPAADTQWVPNKAQAREELSPFEQA